MGNLLREGRSAKAVAVRDRVCTLCRVLDELDITVLDGVHDMRATFKNLVDGIDGNALFCEMPGCAAGGHNLESHLDQSL